MKQTKITDYFHSEKSANTEKINNKLKRLRDECIRIRDEYLEEYQFAGDMGILAEYILALEDKINSMC